MLMTQKQLQNVPDVEKMPRGIYVAAWRLQSKADGMLSLSPYKCLHFQARLKIGVYSCKPASRTGRTSGTRSMTPPHACTPATCMTAVSPVSIFLVNIKACTHIYGKSQRETTHCDWKKGFMSFPALYLSSAPTWVASPKPEVRIGTARHLG